eukprot:14357-Heterococcus_DN1.PRE.2
MSLKWHARAILSHITERSVLTSAHPLHLISSHALDGVVLGGMSLKRRHKNYNFPICCLVVLAIISRAAAQQDVLHPIEQCEAFIARHEDPNTGDAMFESDSIIEHLFETYGPGKSNIPWILKGRLSVAGCGSASAIRGFGGGIVSRNQKPGNSSRQFLTLYGYEGSPFVKPVRELLTGLELPHRMIFCARGSANRAKLSELTGKQFQRLITVIIGVML